MDELKADGFDNRAGENPEGIMYGFVYFNDGRRVTYATGHGVTGSTGEWPGVTATHIKLAEDYLNAQAPGWNTKTEKV
jgi:hypothetical protein